MAIYHLSIQAIRRSEGRNAIACAAYRAGCCLQFTRTGQWFDHSRRVRIQSALVMPIGVQLPRARGVSRPHELRGRLWNAAEDAETRINSVTARELNVAIPHELDAATGWDLALSLGRHLADAYGVAADVVIHPPSPAGDQRNLHAHIMWTTRTVSVVADEFAFGRKVRVLDDRTTGPQEIVAIRNAWAGLANAALSDAGVVDDLGQPVRISALSLVDQGIDREPDDHDGPMITNLRRLGAIPSVQTTPATAPSPPVTPVDLLALWPTLTELPVENDPAAVARGWLSLVPRADPDPILVTPAAPPAPSLSVVMVGEGVVVGRLDPHRGVGRPRARLIEDGSVDRGMTAPQRSAPTAVSDVDDAVERTPHGPTVSKKPPDKDEPKRRGPKPGPVVPAAQHLFPPPPAKRRPKPKTPPRPSSPLQPLDILDPAGAARMSAREEEAERLAAAIVAGAALIPAGSARSRGKGKGPGRKPGKGAALAKGKVMAKAKARTANGRGR